MGSKGSCYWEGGPANPRKACPVESWAQQPRASPRESGGRAGSAQEPPWTLAEGVRCRWEGSHAPFRHGLSRSPTGGWKVPTVPSSLIFKHDPKSARRMCPFTSRRTLSGLMSLWETDTHEHHALLEGPSPGRRASWGRLESLLGGLARRTVAATPLTLHIRSRAQPTGGGRQGMGGTETVRVREVHGGVRWPTTAG